MTTMIDPKELSDYLSGEFPDARCSLWFHSPFECLVAVSLSAQTTDEAVNRVTPALFDAYPTPEQMGAADIEDVEAKIKSIGLYHNKARNLIALGKALQERFGGVVPHTIEELTSLPGVGVKTASVVLIESFDIPAFPVDTHISRICKRLGYAKDGDSAEKIMSKVKRLFDEQEYKDLHHRLIAFGRKICHAKNPECEKCPFTGRCRFKADAR